MNTLILLQHPNGLRTLGRLDYAGFFNDLYGDSLSYRHMIDDEGWRSIWQGSEKDLYDTIVRAIDDGRSLPLDTLQTRPSNQGDHDNRSGNSLSCGKETEDFKVGNSPTPPSVLPVCDRGPGHM